MHDVRIHRVVIHTCACLIAVGVSACGCRKDREGEESSRPLSLLPGEYRLPPYAEYLKDVKICLDPGHGGRSDQPGYKRGPTGLREAEVNLRVALFLRGLLEASGAEVFMTRCEDVYLHEDESEDLRLRAEVANENDCDVFLSIHHNAGARPTANFSSVWYHGSVDHSPASLDVAREISTALIDELELPEHLGCPVLSDYLMYPKAGFAVLRHAKVPAVLSEASFHSNPEEEERLRDPQYNRREAYALFLGLARYAYQGVPRARLVTPADGVVAAGGSREVVIELDDGISRRKSWGWEQRLIPRAGVLVQVNDKDVGFRYTENPDRVMFELPEDLKTGPVRLAVQFENLFKHANTRPVLLLEVEKPPV